MLETRHIFAAMREARIREIAREEGITELQAYRKLKAEEVLRRRT